MDREDFNKLDINTQVDYFNKELKKEDNTFNFICRELQISKNTILSRFRSFGYEPVRQGQGTSKGQRQKIIKFSKSENLTAENSEVKNLTDENSAMKNKSKASDPKDINLILKRIELLEQKIKILESANLHSVKKEPLNGDLRSHKNFINSYENTTTKTFKIDVEVYQELEKLFDKYKMYKKQDIVSSLLKYALDNIE